MNLKEQFARFRAWQKAPIHYPDISPEEHTCANCGHRFRGNFCPVCRQEAGDGRITWRWVFKTVMVVWGMDSRSLPYSLLQLILRPGYLIGEYISGHRQVSFTPLKMLLLVALLYAVILQLAGINTGADTTNSLNTNLSLLNDIYSWLSTHPGWNKLAFTVIMILPTWVLFRFAPRHTRHTLPEGAFIQIFMATLMLLITLVAHISNWLNLLIPIYYYITYRQLFGYGWWGTLWRLMLSGMIWVFISLSIANLIYDISNDPFVQRLKDSLLFLFFVAVLLVAGYFISKKNAHRRQLRIE